MKDFLGIYHQDREGEITAMSKACHSVSFLQICNGTASFLNDARVVTTHDSTHRSEIVNVERVGRIQGHKFSFDNDEVVTKARHWHIGDEFGIAGALNLDNTASSH